MILRIMAFLGAALAASAAGAQCQHWGAYPLVQGGCVNDPGSFNNLAELSIGPAPPQNAFSEGASQGKPWFDISVTPAALRICKSTCSTSFVDAEWFTWARFDFAGGTINPPIGGGVVTVASSGVVDLGRYPQAAITITGNATISSFGSSLPPGQAKFLIFTGTPTLSYSPTGIVLPGSANIVAQPNDVAIAIALGAGKTQVLYPIGGSGGSPLPSQQSITTGGTHSITIASGDVLVNFNGAVTLTLPTSGPIRVWDVGGFADAHPITVLPPSGTINGGSLWAIVSKRDSAIFVYDSTNYTAN